jgi:hypothetical protein
MAAAVALQPARSALSHEAEFFFDDAIRTAGSHATLSKIEVNVALLMYGVAALIDHAVL